MLSPQERHVLVALTLILMLGAAVKGCRSRAAVEEIPKETLPSLDQIARPKPPVD